ncbi:MAG TPA: hypothetical protein PLJ21_00585 [Pseudobdellovibrionaceae bacterium]|mgnify:CR=1 FL=1|nr:hypothetical protein [Pseudobdellovibrionaceae bacterium]
MSLHKALKDLKFDKRLIEKNINQGVITPEDVKKHLESLPDCSANIDIISFDTASEMTH